VPDYVPAIPAIALERIAGETVTKGKITNTDINRAYGLLKQLGLGHFVIRSPSGDVGVAIYHGGFFNSECIPLKRW